MSDEILVKVEGLSKKYCRSLKRSLWYGVQDVTAEMFVRSGTRDTLRADEFWALRDVSLELRRGQVLGLIGPNGAGKSTLLKLLNGIIKPDVGRITLRGRVGALIELGAGFNPVLTARENIYVNAAVLGFCREEIDRRFDHIVDFAGVRDFLDAPVRSFSSGMKVRLGFAIAAQLEPDVLIIDEVLSVGDEGFRAKSFNAIRRISKAAAVIVVSHRMPEISRYCSHAKLLLPGSAWPMSDDVPAVIQGYLEQFRDVDATRVESERARILEVRTLDLDGQPVDRIESSESLVIEVDFQAAPEVRNVACGVAFTNQKGQLILQSHSQYDNVVVSNDGSQTTIRVRLERVPLAPGPYTLTVGIDAGGHEEVLARWHDFKRIAVGGDFVSFAPVVIRGRWSSKTVDSSSTEPSE